tara:strand:- start:18 stop:242 length:225 start_codon:yes stop_codon:yes gene_type:complete
MLLTVLMINTIYIYPLFILIFVGSIFYLIQNLRSSNNELNNKILLKNLLEGLELDLPEELKALDNSNRDPQKLS